jgi:hypothetical protein
MVSMPTNSVTLVLNGELFNDFIEGDFIEATPVNPLTERVNGANGSFAVTGRVDSHVWDFRFRFLRFSKSDNRFNDFINNDNIEILNGTLKEEYTDVARNSQALENWTLTNGTITTQPTFLKNNQTGEFSAEYVVQFRDARRLI